jgi:hypothetical protein
MKQDRGDIMNTLGNFKKQLREKDLDTLPHRALRAQDLDSLKVPLVPTFRVWDYAHEAKSSYINGCYRSCIICSSNAVEQSFVHILIVTSEDWEKVYWEFRMTKNTFGKIIDKVKHESKKNKELESLAKFLGDADWLRRIRNEIVVHPTYIPEYLELKRDDELVIANRIMLRDIRHLLKFLSSQKRKQLEMEKLTAKTSEGKIIRESEPLKEFLENPTKIDVSNYLDWWAFQTGLLNYLALEAYERMSKVINGLYYHKLIS